MIRMRIRRIIAMSLFNKAMNWFKTNWRFAAIGAALFIGVGIFAVIMVLSARNSPVSTISETPLSPPPAPQPVSEPVEKPPETIAEPEDEPASAYDAGMQTGEAFNESKDALLDFLQGFNEATGASDRARELWESSKDRVNEWLEENFPPDEQDDSDAESDR